MVPRSSGERYVLAVRHSGCGEFVLRPARAASPCALSQDRRPSAHGLERPEGSGAKQARNCVCTKALCLRIEPHAAIAQERIVLGRKFSGTAGPVCRTDVEGAEITGRPRSRPHRPANVLRILLLLARCLGAVHEQKLSAEQPDPLGALGESRYRFLRRGILAATSDPRPSRMDRRLRRRRQPASARCDLVSRARVVPTRTPGGIQ